MPSLVVAPGVLVFIGAVGAIPEHRCLATVIGIGVDAPFTLTACGLTRSVRLGKVSPGIVRSVDAQAGRLGVMVVDAALPIADPLPETTILRAGLELADRWSLESWQALVAAVGCDRPRVRDPRVAMAAAMLHANCERAVASQEIAGTCGLSASRLERLFSQDMGLPMRSYRNWCRLMRVVEAVRRGDTLTSAAVYAGFYDAAHFGHVFREAFGVAPGFVFGGDVRIRVVDDDQPT